MSITSRSLLRLAALATVAAAIFFAGSLGGRAEADDNFSDAVILLDPANPSVTSGTQIVLEIELQSFPDPDGLGAYEVALTWDPNVLVFPEANGFTNGPLLGSTGRTPTCLPVDFDADNDGDDDLGFVKVGCITFGAAPPGPTDDGLLATIRLDTFCAGNTIIAFHEGTTLSDPLASSKEIPINISGANATVTGGAPCGAGGLVGDANCNETVNAIDAAIILQADAGLLGSLPCPELADVNGSGSADALDSLLILQFDAGLLPQLPP